MGAIYTIPPAYGFAKALTEGLIRQYSLSDLAKIQIYLPTRRAVRTVQEAFGEIATGQSLLLPKLFSIGDVDADDMVLTGSGEVSKIAANLPPVLTSTHQLFLLSRLVFHAWDKTIGGDEPKSNAQVFAYASALRTLLNTIETEGVDLSVLSELTPEDPVFEGFWERAGRFIALIQEVWPAIEQETGRVSPAKRRRRVLEILVQDWSKRPPQNPILLAGTTATIPAVADLASVVQDLPYGQIILPGLDQSLDAETWVEVIKSPTHPQHGLAKLLSKIGISPGNVKLWFGCTAIDVRDRHAALSASQKPASVSITGAEHAYDLDGLALVEAPSPEVEARSIAIFLREALQEPHARAALVTPDRDLAGRVTAELLRWGVEVDNSAGLPLTDSALGRIIQRTLGLLTNAWQDLDLTRVLAHPLANFGMSYHEARSFSWDMDLKLRGLGTMRPATAFDWPNSPASNELLDLLLSGFPPMESKYFSVWLDRHLAVLEKLAPDAEQLWSGAAGSVITQLFEDAQASSRVLPPMLVEDYAEIITTLLSETFYREPTQTKPRVSILGTLEARLLHVDSVALGGLNEGVWPKETDVGPWMNRPTRAQVGLPSPERKVGLAAHDLAQAFSATNVLMSRTTRVDGAPTLSSRWIERLKTFLDRRGQADILTAKGNIYLRSAIAMDLPVSKKARKPPSPVYGCPPLSVRPKTLFATDIGLLVTNPYGFYAKRILGLRALDPRGSHAPEKRWGIMVHEVLEQANTKPDLSIGDLFEIAETRLESEKIDEIQASLWRVQLQHTLHEFWRLNHAYRGYPNLIEKMGSYSVAGHVIKGKADRVVILPDCSVVLDYKTGRAATEANQRQGLDPQLSILGLIAANGGFDDAQGQHADRDIFQAFLLLPKRLHERGEERRSGGKLRSQVHDGLTRLLEAYQDPGQPYFVAPFGEEVGRASPRYDDYGHLARRAGS
ncbi:MAG: PD-(D/E)XK nuclease family protein [Alphaproteobacteria bacterium]